MEQVYAYAAEIAPGTFVRARPIDRPHAAHSRWLIFRDGELLLANKDLPTTSPIPASSPLPSEASDAASLYLGALDDTSYFAVEVPADDPIPAGLQAVPLRSMLATADSITGGIAGYAAEMLYWRRTGRHCPVCGTPTESRTPDWGRVCPNCGHVGYPRVSPAVLILITDGDRILLAAKPGWDRYSILAGFVEPAETLEDCVRRETFEEVGLTVDDLRYFGSQDWPFPHQLMIGFTARHAGGQIRVDNDELDRADWFTRDNLPALPPKISLSRQMIDRWIENP